MEITKHLDLHLKDTKKVRNMQKNITYRGVICGGSNTNIREELNELVMCEPLTARKSNRIKGLFFYVKQVFSKK